MSLYQRMDFSGLGYAGETPHYNLYIDYGGAFQAAADAFYADATSICPVDTGFLLSTIGASADSEGMDAYADASYAEYVNSWAGFFEAGWQTALAVADAWCDATWNDALIEEYEMILMERDEALAVQQNLVDEATGKLDEKINEKEAQEAKIDELKAIEDAIYAEWGGSGWATGIAEDIAMAEIELEMIKLEVAQAEEDKRSAEIEYSIVEEHYATILAYY